MSMKRANVSEFGNLLLKWFGVFGTGFTVFSNLQSFIDFSNFIRNLTDTWREFVTALVNYILRFIDVQLDVSDAVMYFAVFSCLIVALSSQGQSSKNWSRQFRLLSWVFAGIFSAIYFTFLVLGSMSVDPRAEDEAVKFFFLSYGLSAIMAIPLFISLEPKRSKILITVGIINFFLAFSLISTVTSSSELGLIQYMGVIVISTIVISMYYVSNPVLISFRTFSISAFIGVLVVLNFASRIIENTILH